MTYYHVSVQDVEPLPQIEGVSVNYDGSKYRFVREWRGNGRYWYLYGYSPAIGRTRSIYIGVDLGNFFNHIQTFRERYL